MPINVAQEAQNANNGGATTIAASLSNTQAGSALAVFVHNASAQSITSVTDGQGNTFAAEDSLVNATDGNLWSSFCAQNIVGGVSANAITANFSASTTRRGIVVAEIRVVKAAALDGHTGQAQLGGGPGTAADAISTGSASNATQPALIYAAAVTNAGSGVISAGTGFTLGAFQLSPWIPTLGASMSTEYKRITSSGAQAATFTQNTGFRTMALMLIFDEQVSAISPVLTRRRRRRIYYTSTYPR